MNKLTNYLIGPELLWIIFYCIVLVIIRLTNSPVKSMDNFWVNTAFIIPLVLIPLTFALYFLPVTMRPLLLLRIWIVVIFGGHFVLNKSLTAHSEQGPGVGTAYIMGMLFIFIMLAVGSILSKIFFK